MDTQAIRPPAHLERKARTDRRLVRAVAARCHGSTLVIGQEGDAWADALRAARQGRVEMVASRQAGGTTRQFATVVLADVAEWLIARNRDASPELLAKAWEHVRPRGRLLVVVPNGDCLSRDVSPRIVKRDLQKLLRPLGRPVVATDQPFRWLVMHVRRPVDEQPRPNRARIDRYHVTARLCRGDVIELGCGEGELAKAINDRGLRVVGVERNALKVERARNRYPGIPFIHSDIQHLNIPEARFDTVLLAELLEHVPDEVGAVLLDRAWRLLRPGGRLIVSVPNDDLIPHPNHVRRFDRRSLGEALRPFGSPHLCVDQPFKWLMMHVTKTP